MTEQLYATIAGIVGVWLSAVGSLSLALFSHIITQNIDCFKLLREEKIRFNDSIIDNDINFAGSPPPNEEALKKSNETARNRSTDALINIESICEQSKDKIKDNLGKDISAIWENIDTIMHCYPSLHRLGKFPFTTKLLTVDDDYKPWLEDYRQRIDYSLVEKTFNKLDTYLNNIEQNELASDDIQPEISKIKNMMNKLRVIGSSINKIDMLKRDYEPIYNIITTVKSKSTIMIMSGTLFFGVLIPLYMLLPIHFINKIPEHWVIIVIFAGLFVCISGTLYIMIHIFNLFIKE